MGPFRLFWKIVALHAGLTLVATLVLLFALGWSQRKAAESRVERRLAGAATLLRAALVEEDLPQDKLQELAQRIDDQTGQHVTLVERDWTILADSRGEPAEMESVRRRPEFVAARAEGQATAIDEEPRDGTPMIYVALRVDQPGSTVGFVRVGAPLTEVDAEANRFRGALIAAAVAVGLVAVAFAMLAAHRVTRPLKLLRRAVASGEELRLPASPRDEVGALAEAFGTMSRDQTARIAELQHQGRQLEENTRLLSTVLGGMIEGVVAVDHSERILFANPAARVMLDLSGLDAVGRPVWEVIRTPKIHDILRTALSGGDNVPVELELPRVQTIVAVMASRLPGTPCPGAVLVMHDVTDLRRLENLRREFVSNVSHELKTPLTSIQAWTETLLDGAVDNPKHNRPFLQRISEQADRLHKLILDLLRLARIESGQDVFEMVAVPVDKVGHACVDAHSAVAAAKGVTLRIAQPAGSLRVQADAEGLRSILDNLVDNAIKYTPSGGTVTVRWKADGRDGLIEVEDTGVGIPADHLARIFERFYRVDKARSRELGGTGLGLSIVKHLTQVFEGRVDVRSRPGAGSTFSVRLPLVK